MIPVILSGGSGTRLWPLSRKQYPKQLIPLVRDQVTLLQDTLMRLEGVEGLQRALLICNQAHRFMVAEQLRARSLAHQGIILEPVGRNTAPAIAVAALQAEALGQGDDLLLVLPADHVILDVAAYHRALAQARLQAEQGKLVTFGVVPRHPETGYGYIRRGGSVTEDEAAFQVFEFVEKPDLSTAERYVESGEYYWNSGMFLFRASRYLEELAQFEPEMVEACRLALARSQMDLDFVRLDESAFAACPEQSIDYAVMEKTTEAVVVPLDAAWSDVGAWSALWEVSDKSEAGNSVHGDVILEATRNSYVYAGSRLVTTLGVDNLVVVETADAVLVADKSCVQDVKRIVQQLLDQNRPEVEQHREVYRPWGCFDSIDNGERYQVKRLVVNPGASLSLQKHFHRAEHWIVVKGTALVVCNDETRLLTENESVYLPLGCLHRLENPGRIPLHLIEVQTGAYLGEDDIVRLDDPYHR
jgi:mannose-1-phosphate guanylyltransferase/mannose-6-phosphate isomerase